MPWLAIGILLVGMLLWAGPIGLAQQPDRWPTTSLLPDWRRNHSVVYDPANNRLLVFGGWNGRRFFNDLWALDLTPSAEKWSRLDAEGVQPRARAFHTAIYDASAGRMIVFGGRGLGRELADVWALDLTPGNETWIELAPSGASPPARYAHTAVYDVENTRMVVFGGVASGRPLDDLWSLDLTPGSEKWTKLSPAGASPMARGFHAAIADESNRRMVLFGGRGAAGNLDDVWVLQLASGSEAWGTLVPGGTAPPTRRAHTAVYDGGRGRMVTFGGLGNDSFLDDLWALDLTLGSEAWNFLGGQLDGVPDSSSISADALPLGEAPTPQAWHTATMDELHDRMLVLGGFGPVQTLVKQWTLDLTVDVWESLSPAWSGLSPNVSMSMQIEDAPDGGSANKLVGSWLDVVVRLSTNSLDAGEGISVTLTAHGNPFGVPTACFRQTDAGTCTPLSVHSVGEGRYRTGIVNLPWFGGTATGNVRFRFYIGQLPDEPDVDLTAQAYFPQVDEERDATAMVRVRDHVAALIVTNRTRLYDVFEGDEVQGLLARLYQLAEGDSLDGAPLGSIFYVDRDNQTVAGWNSWEVDYSSESAANAVPRIIDGLIERWAGLAASPTYLLIAGDDDIVPFYRKKSFGDEAQYRSVGNGYPPLDEAVSHDFYFTDNPYADLDGEWQQGDLEMAAGRIVGGSVADMLAFIDNSLLGPVVDSGNAVVASVLSEEYCPISEQYYDFYRDAVLDGPENDMVDALRDKWGLDVLNDVETPVTIETRAWGLEDLLAIMGQRFVIFHSMSHAENNVVCLTDDCEPRSEQLTPSRVSVLEEETQALSLNRPFFYIDGCRAGMSAARRWDEGLVWALARYGASGIIASAGLSYGNPEAEVSCCGETLTNEFWLHAIENQDPVDTVGLALRNAKQDFDPAYDWTLSEEKTVQTFTLFGLPWMTLPQSGETRNTAGGGHLWLQELRNVRASRLVADDAYVLTASVDASQWSTVTLGSFDLVQVEGLELSRYDDGPVVPVAAWRLPLPSRAAVTTVTVILSDPVDLGMLDIPTFLHRPDYPGGPPSIYVATADSVGVYPPEPYRLDVTPLDSWQLHRLSLIPLVYDAISDQATLYQQVQVTVTYTSTTPLAVIGLRTNRKTYLPGQPIAAWAWLQNVSDAELLVTPTLAVVDAAGQTWGLRVAEPVTLPGAMLSVVPMSITLTLEEGAYQLRFAAWWEGEMVAGLARDVSVVAGGIVALTGPDALLPNAIGQFHVTFANTKADPAAAMVHLGVFDPAGQPVSDLRPQATVIPGATTATLSFDWPGEGRSPGTYTAVAQVLSGGHVYGPLSRAVRIGGHVYLPLVLRESP